jgi:hypothetical protein
MKMKLCLLIMSVLGLILAAGLLLPSLDGRRSHRHAVHFRTENAPPRSISFVVGTNALPRSGSFVVSTNLTTTQSNRGE